MKPKKKAIEFNKLSQKIRDKFLEDAIYNDAGVSEELDRSPWGAGQGRYGDDIDPDSDIKTMNFFHSILKPKGLLFLAVPLGEKQD